MLALSLQIGDQHWQKTDPALETREVIWLIEWLEEVADEIAVFARWKHNRLRTQIFFTEPNLSFEVLLERLSVMLPGKSAQSTPLSWAERHLRRERTGDATPHRRERTPLGTHRRETPLGTPLLIVVNGRPWGRHSSSS